MYDSTDITILSGNTAPVRVVHKHTNITIAAMIDNTNKPHIKGPPLSNNDNTSTPTNEAAAFCSANMKADIISPLIIMHTICLFKPDTCLHSFFSVRPACATSLTLLCSPSFCDCYRSNSRKYGIYNSRFSGICHHIFHFLLPPPQIQEMVLTRGKQVGHAPFAPQIQESRAEQHKGISNLSISNFKLNELAAANFLIVH